MKNLSRSKNHFDKEVLDMIRRVLCFVVSLALFLVDSIVLAQTDTLLRERFILGAPMAAAHGSAHLNGMFSSLASGDVNNDGYPDIAATHGFRVGGLYLNHGNRSFAAEQVLSKPWWDVDENTGATSIALGDLDLDGNLDMVIPIYGDHYVEHMVQLYRGRGDGTFNLWPVDGYNALTDFEGVNQDGVNDGIIVARGAANPMFAGIGDFNGDGRPDVVVSGNNGAWSVDVLTQSASREFSVADSDPAGQNPQFFGLGDFNEDGYPDLAVGALYNGVLVFLNDANGRGTLHRVGGTYLSRNHQYVIVADFNGDDHDDIAARGNEEARVYILYGDGTGNFPLSAKFPVSGSDGYLAAADIDNDDDKDLVVASKSVKRVDVLLNDGNGHFGPPEFTSLDAAPWGIAADDFDRDGSVDVAVSRGDNTVQVLWNRPADIHDGLLAYWSFDDCTATDVTGNGYDGKISGSVACVNGISGGKSIRFHAGNDHISAIADAHFSSKQITLSAWINPTGPGTDNPRIIGVGPAQSSHQYYSIILEGTKNKRHAWLYCSASDKNIAGINFIANNSGWHHVAATINGKTQRLYVDGKLDMLIGNNALLPIFDRALIQIGYSDKLTDQFVGSIDEVRIYNRPLTSSEIHTLYYQGHYPTIKGSVAWGTSHTVACQNITLDTMVTISETISSAWDCEQAGLVVQSGDKVKVTIEGTKY